MSINTNNGIPQFNNYVGFINKNNIKKDDPISRNKIRSTYWNIKKLENSNFYEIRSKKYPLYYLHLGDTPYFNTKCPVDGVVKFSKKHKSNWKIEPDLIN